MRLLRMGHVLTLLVSLAAFAWRASSPTAHSFTGTRSAEAPGATMLAHPGVR